MLLLDDVKGLPASKWGMASTPQMEKRLVNAAHRARAYSFDAEASRKVGSFSVNCLDLLTQNMEFAIPPFDCTYVEIDIDAAIQATGRANPAGTDSTADWKLGFLMDHGTIYTMACDKSGSHAAVSPWGYIDTSAVEDVNVKHMVNSPLAELGTILLGTSVPDVDKDGLSKFIDRFHLGYFGRKDVSHKALDYMLQGSIGEIRYLISALLFIQSKRAVTIRGTPFERRITRGKSRVFMAHSTVTIDLEGEVEMRRAFNVTDRASPRAHEVPSHFAHRYGDRNCEHHWITREDEPTHWDCPKCGRFRYLRKQHMRGDASLGFVTRDYEIVAEGRK